MRKILFALLATVSLSSCWSLLDPMPDPAPKPSKDPELRWVMPKAGSQYRMEIVTTDSGSSVNANIDNDIFIIVADNVPFAGRNAYRYGWSNTFRQYYVTFEANGDTGYEIDGGIDIYPTGTKGRTPLPTQEGYRENLGWEKITLAGVRYDAIRVTQHSVEGSSSGVKRTINQTWWFIPSLGFPGKVVRNVVTDSYGSRSTYTRSQTLVEIIR
jgi:hypothetical protein